MLQIFWQDAVSLCSGKMARCVRGVRSILSNATQTRSRSLDRAAGKNASAVPSTTDDIETVRLCAFAPSGSPLDLHSDAIVPGAMNNAG